jgi:hypothetical protein
MALLDNRLIHVALLVAAVYVIVQIMNKNSAQEHLDTLITPEGNAAPKIDIVPVTGAGAGTTGNVLSVPAITTGSPAPALQPVSLDGTNKAGQPLVNVTGTALTTTASAPLPVSSTDESLMAAAPVALPGESTADFTKTVEAVDPDFLFGRRTSLDPSELIPKNQDGELYAGIKPDPKLNQNFLQNRFSLGIDVSKPKRGFVNDLRGSPAPPALSVVSPWGNPTIPVDTMRRSLADVS